LLLDLAPKEVVMTNSGFRCLMLAAVVAAGASLLALSDAQADETGRTASSSETTPAIQIVPGVSQASKAVDVVIAPAGQVAEKDDTPILVAPYEEQESDEPKTEKKPARPSAKVKQVAKKKDAAKKEAARAKSGAKKPAAAPMAKETASEKARAEWQKKRSSNNASSKDVKTAVDKAARSAAAAKKREMLANGPSTAGAVASAKAAKQPAAKADHSESASARKDSRSYREIYNSIPFSRSEYDANPAYRHQATMEIMLGQLHPIIVAPPQQETKQEITIRFLPVVRPGYRPYWAYPWR
jgi:hypothetical protein